jgi:hypothetical protein
MIDNGEPDHVTFTHGRVNGKASVIYAPDRNIQVGIELRGPTRIQSDRGDHSKFRRFSIFQTYYSSVVITIVYAFCAFRTILVEATPPCD